MKFSMMKQQHFPAVLKTLRNKVIEYGIAYISEDQKSIEFQSEFVPICEMGTPLKIVRMQGSIETQSFVGEVYLSSQNLLRLVSLADEVLPGAAVAYTYDVEFDGMATAVVTLPEELRRPIFPFGKRQPPAPRPHTFPITVYGISLSQIRITCDMLLAQGQLLTLNIQDPIVLNDLSVVVDLPISMRADQINGYRCRILNLRGANLFQLEPYVTRISVECNKLFPPVEPAELKLKEEEAEPDAASPDAISSAEEDPE